MKHGKMVTWFWVDNVRNWNCCHLSAIITAWSTNISYGTVLWWCINAVGVTNGKAQPSVASLMSHHLWHAQHFFSRVFTSFYSTSCHMHACTAACTLQLIQIGSQVQLELRCTHMLTAGCLFHNVKKYETCTACVRVVEMHMISLICKKQTSI